MTRVSVTNNIEVNLTLNREEACYIKAMLQNNISGESESVEQSKMREDLFNALPSFQQLTKEI